MPIFEIGIGTALIPVLADSGASISLLHVSVLKDNPELQKLVVACDMRIKSISGDVMTVDSRIVAPIKIGNREIDVEFFLSKNAISDQYRGILGHDFLRGTQSIFNYKHGLLAGLGFTVSWGKEGSPRVINSVELDLPVIGAAMGKVQILPGTERLVMVRAQGKQTVVENVLIEPTCAQLEKRKLWIARSVSNVSENKEYPVRVANTSKETVIIRKGEKLVRIEPIHAADPESINSCMADKDELGEDFEAWGGEINLEHLEGEEKIKMQALLEEFKDTFAHSVKDLGGCSTLFHKINLTDSVPVRQRHYRVPHHLKTELNNQVNELLETGMIEPSESPYSAPVLLVKKKDGSYRLCTDFRKLNLKTVPDSFPIPNIQELVDNLSGATWFTTLDLCSGFFQVHIDPEDTQKAAFATEEGLFEWKRMPFGMRNSPGTFQRLMELVLSGLKPLQVGVYLDDIVVASSGTVDEHIRKLRLVLERLRGHGLKLKPSKCCFLKKTITYLGFTISGGKVFPDGRNVEAVKNFPSPSNKKQLRGFLGLTGFYRRFIRNYAECALPLTDLTKKDCKFVWSEGAQSAFEKLRDGLVSTPCVKLPDFSRPFSVSCDASKFALGAVLSQDDDEGVSHPVAFGSRKLKGAEVNYSTVEKEMLGVVFAVTYFKHYLYGKSFVVYCDQASLSCALNMRDPTSRIARWAMTLQQYDYKVKYKPGKLNVIADYLSRPVQAAEIIEQKFFPEVGTSGRVLSHQRKDRFCNEVRRALEESRQVVPNWLDFFFKEGVLYCVNKKPAGNRAKDKDRLVVPLTLVPDILRMCHDSDCVTHQGLHRTIDRVKERFYWPGIYGHVKNHIASCPSCIERRGHRPNKQADLQRIPIASRPLEMIAIDAVGPLPQSYEGNKYILVLSDYFSRWPEAYAVPDIKSKTVSFVLERFISCHGVPSVLISDRGSNFLSKSISMVYESLGIEKHTTTAYHPQGDGVVEHLNATLINSLSHLVNESQEDWDRRLPYALLAHRTARHASTGETPAYLLYGRDLQLPYDVLVGGLQETYADRREYVGDLVYRLQGTYMAVKKSLVEAAERQERTREKSSVGKRLRVGDVVYLFTPSGVPGT